MKPLLYALAFSVVFFMAHAGAAEISGDFPVKVTPSPNNKVPRTNTAYDDVITIKDGKLNSKVNAGYGYAAGAVTVKTEGGKTLLTADLEHPKHGKNHYELEVKGTQIAGTLKWGKVGESGKDLAAEYTIAPK